MAHQQTSMLSKALHSNFNIPNISLIRLPRIFFSQNRHNLGRKTATLNCCMECTDTNNGQYYEYERQAMAPQPAQYPRPTEIEWTKEICNSVQLIGNVGTPIQIKHLDSGKVLSCTSLAVKKSSTDTFWINLTFWDELAHVAFEHVQKGQQINVSGRLVSDTVEGDDGKQQTYYKVVVSELNFIKRSISPVSLYGDDSDSGKRSKNYGANSTGSVEELWQAFFANPVEWWDNRKYKKSPKYPDFKHKDTGEALWVEGRYNPPWVRSQLSLLDRRMETSPDENANVTNFIVGDDFRSF